jgi:hypothetical protein
MFTPLAKLAIGLSATMATAFYYIAAAPPASAQYVCGPGNFSSACGGGAPSPATPSPPPIADPVQEPVVESPATIADPVEEVPVVDSPATIADPVEEPVVESPATIADPVEEVPVIESPATIVDPRVPPPEVERPEYWIYNPPTTVRPPTAIPEPGTVVALLVTGAGILCSARKRNKQVRQQR